MMKIYFKRNRHRFPVKVRRYIPKKTKRTVLFRASCAVIAIIIILLIIDTALRPVIKDAAANTVKNNIGLLVNNTINSYLGNSKTKYEKLVSILQDESGRITAITSDSAAMNVLKAGVTEAIGEQLKKNDSIVVKVPWGTLTKSRLLNGRGAAVKIKCSVYGYSVSDIDSKFESAGINQTRHSIYITVSVSAGAYVATYYVRESVKTKVLVAETVIVGTVPQVYLG